MKARSCNRGLKLLDLPPPSRVRLRPLFIPFSKNMPTDSSDFSSGDTEWWKKTTVYHIYPRSFFDSNGDGIGDIPGIIEKLDYHPRTSVTKQSGFLRLRKVRKEISDTISAITFRSLPITAIWRCSKSWCREVHGRDMKLVFDLVLNHTSNEHAWFKESASSRDNPKADWYIWRDGKGRNGTRPPNNWRAMAGNKAWTYYPERDQFNYNAFLPFQPDLNYHNPEVKQAMFDIVRFWLDKGRRWLPAGYHQRNLRGSRASQQSSQFSLTPIGPLAIHIFSASEAQLPARKELRIRNRIKKRSG